MHRGNSSAQDVALAAKSVRKRILCREGIRLFAKGKLPMPKGADPEPDSVTMKPKAE